MAFDLAKTFVPGLVDAGLATNADGIKFWLGSTFSLGAGDGRGRSWPILDIHVMRSVSVDLSRNQVCKLRSHSFWAAEKISKSYGGSLKKVDVSRISDTQGHTTPEG